LDIVPKRRKSFFDFWALFSFSTPDQKLNSFLGGTMGRETISELEDELAMERDDNARLNTKVENLPRGAPRARRFGRAGRARNESESCGWLAWPNAELELRERDDDSGHPRLLCPLSAKKYDAKLAKRSERRRAS
jgi:hypothetical protein